MAGIGSYTGAIGKTKTKGETRIEATAKLENTVSALDTQEVLNLIAQMVDLGYVVRRDETSLCPNCGAMLDEGDTCPKCAMAPGEVADKEELSDDTEILRDEDLPPSSEEQDEQQTLTELSPEERFQEALLSIGWEMETAETGGLLLARVWDEWSESPQGKQVLRAGGALTVGIDEIAKAGIHKVSTSRTDNGLAEQLLLPSVLPVVIRAFRQLAEEAGRQIPPPAEILIERDRHGTWQVNVADPLENMQVLCRDGRVRITGKFSMPVQQFTALLEARRNKLRGVAGELLKQRSGFFNAKDIEEANMALVSRLTQQEVAEGTGINETTLSGWCSKGRVLLRTPLGVVPLGDFFQADHDQQVRFWITEALRARDCPQKTQARNKFVIDRLITRGVHIIADKNNGDGEGRFSPDGGRDGTVMSYAYETIRKKIAEVAAAW